MTARYIYIIERSWDPLQGGFCVKKALFRKREVGREGGREGNCTHQVRILELVDDLDVVELDVEILVHALERAAQLDVVLELHRDLVVNQRLEKAVRVSLSVHIISFLDSFPPPSPPPPPPRCFEGEERKGAGGKQVGWLGASYLKKSMVYSEG